jgi:hypothetical protein
VSNEQRGYISYLLRLWQTKSGEELVWRASLEGSQTGERQGFTSLDALFAFLRRQTDTVTASSEDRNEDTEQRG